MNQHVVKPSELMSVLKDSGMTDYRFKGFLSGGKFPKVLLENTVNNQEVIGKFVSHPSEGELKVWPKLHHESLNPLLEVLWINKIKILISPVVGKCLSSFIHDIGFAQHPLCFERKKSYLKDILLGLDYMHRNSFCILNLSETNIKICSSDKAVISDFSFAVNRKKITKASLPAWAFYKPREVRKANAGDFLNGDSIDMWYCGLLFFQVFTQHLLLIGNGDVCDSLEYIDSELLRRANGGAFLPKQTAPDLKRFLKNLLSPNPNFRISANEAFKSSFIHTVHNRLDEKARKFWKTDANSNCGRIPDSFPGNELRSSKTGSTVSEVDVSAISVNSVNGDSLNGDANNRKEKSFLVKTKSEPGTQIYHKSPNRKCLGRASLPSFNQNRSMYSSTSFQEENSSYEQISSLPSDLQYDDSFEYDQEDATIQSMFSSSELHEEYPYETFLTEWEEDFYPADMEDLMNMPYSDDSLEEIQIFSGMRDDSLDDIPSEIYSMNRSSTAYTNHPERSSYTTSRREVPEKCHRSSYGSERNVQDMYCKSGPPRQKPPRPSLQKKLDCNVADTRSVFTSTDSPPCLKPPSPDVGIYSTSQMTTESAYCTSPGASDIFDRDEDAAFLQSLNANETVYPEMKYNLQPPLKSFSPNASWYPTNEKPVQCEVNILPNTSELFRGKKTSIGANSSRLSVYEKYSGVDRKSLSAASKGASPSRCVDSRMIIDKGEQLCCEDSESPIRQKWYHKFCVLCKCTIQRQRKH